MLGFGDILGSLLGGVESGAEVATDYQKDKMNTLLKQGPEGEEKKEQDMAVLKMVMDNLGGKYGKDFGSIIARINLGGSPGEILQQLKGMHASRSNYSGQPSPTRTLNTIPSGNVGQPTRKLIRR